MDKKIKYLFEDDFFDSIESFNLSSKRENLNKQKRVICINSNTVYNSIKEATNKTGANVTSALRGSMGVKSCGLDKDGNINHWMYYDKYLEKLKKGEEVSFEKNPQSETKNPKAKKGTSNKKIICLNNMKTYDSIKEANDKLDIYLHNALKKGVFTARTCGLDEDGNINSWMYYDKYLEKVKNNEDLSIETGRSQTVAVRCLETNEVFKSLKEASEKMHVLIRSIVLSCKTGESVYAIKNLDAKLKLTTWEYATNKTSNIKPVSKNTESEKRKHFRSVICLNNMKKYDSIAKADRELGIYLHNALKKGIYTAKTCGLDEDGNINRWMYYDKYLEKVENNEDLSVDIGRGVEVAVRCIETGEEFKSITQAFEKTNVAKRSIVLSCKTGKTVESMRNSDSKLKFSTWEYIK